MKVAKDLSKSSFHLNPELNRQEEDPEKDEQLVWERFTRGDDQCLIYIYRKYADILYRYGRQFTSRKELIRDCIQDLFFTLIKKRTNLSGAQSVKGYLFASFKRKILRDIKKEEKLNLEEDGFLFGMSKKSFSIFSTISEIDLSVIRKTLNQLSVQQREVILLHFYEGLTYAEIATIMDIKVRSVRALTYRALDSLRKQLSPHQQSLFYIVYSPFLWLNF